MFPVHDPYHILIPKLARYFGYNVELTNTVNNPLPRQNCDFCDEITDQLQVILNAWRPFLQQVRDAYNRVPTNFDYNSRYHRGIYMLAYFPFYIEPIYYSLESLINEIRFLIENHTATVSIMGGGALPELLGISKLINERRNDIERIKVKVFDKFENWSAEIENCTKELLPLYFNGEILIQRYRTDLIDLSHEDIINISQADIIIMQNTINDLSPADYNTLRNNLLLIWNNSQRDSHIVLIDLNFNEVRDFMKNLQEVFFNNGGHLLLPLNQIPFEHRPSIPFCSHLDRMLFSGQHGLLPRRRVNYYRFIVKK